MISDNENEISLEEEDELIRKSKFQKIKKQFSLFHFLNFEPTKKLIENDYIQKYLDTAGKEISNFYTDLHYYNQLEYSTIFRFDNNKIAAAELSSIVFNNIKKEYNLDIFEDNPSLANSLIEHEKNKSKQTKKQFIPVKKRIFNWKTKTYD